MTGFGHDKKSVKKIRKDAQTNNLKAQVITKAFLFRTLGISYRYPASKPNTTEFSPPNAHDTTIKKNRDRK